MNKFKELEQIGKTSRAKSTFANVNNNGDTDKLRSKGPFLGTPNIPYERRSSNASASSLDSNMFRRGIESFRSNHKKSTIYEVKYLWLLWIAKSKGNC